MNSPDPRITNPFASIIVTDPWTGTEPDCPGVNPGAFELAVDLLDQRIAQPGMGGLTVWGEPGAGKTHLIKQLLASDRDFAGVHIYLDRDITDLPSFVLGQVVSDLQRCRNGSNECQLSMLLRRILIPEGTEVSRLQDFVKDHPETVAAAKAYLRATRYHTPLEEDFLAALFAYPDESTKREAVTFLSGECVDEEAAKEMGISARSARLALPNSRQSFGLLQAFGKLFEGHQPLVFLFDQLENVGDSDVRIHFCHFLSDLISRNPGILTICFVRYDFLDDAKRQQLDEHVEDRIFAHEVHLPGCTKDNAASLIRERLKWAGKSAAFTDEAIGRVMEEVKSQLNPPRKIIQAAQRMRERVESVEVAPRPQVGSTPPQNGSVPSVSPAPAQTTCDLYSGILQTTFQAELDKIDPGKIPELSNKLIDSVVFDYLTEQPHGKNPWQIREVKRGKTRIVQLALDQDAKNAVMVIGACNSMPGDLSAVIRDLHEWRRNGARSVLIRDSRNKVPPKAGQWRAIAKSLAAFLNDGGEFYAANLDEVKQVVAMGRLHSAVIAKDVTSVGDDGKTKVVTVAEYKSFLGQVTLDLFEGIFSGGTTVAMPTACSKPTEPEPRPPGLPKLAKAPQSRSLSLILGLLNEYPNRYSIEQIRIRLQEKLGVVLGDEVILEEIRQAGDSIISYFSDTWIFVRRQDV